MQPWQTFWYKNQNSSYFQSVRVWRVSSKKTDKAYLSVFYSWNNSLEPFFFFLFFLIWLNSFLVIKHVDKVAGIKMIKWFIYLKSLDCDFFNFTQLCTVSPGWGWKWKWVTIAQYVSSSHVLHSSWVEWTETFKILPTVWNSI